MNQGLVNAPEMQYDGRPMHVLSSIEYIGVAPCKVCTVGFGYDRKFCSRYCDARIKYSFGEHYSISDFPCDLDANKKCCENDGNVKKTDSPTAIIRRAEKKSIAIGYSSLNDAIAKMYESGNTYKFIGETLGIAKETASRRYRKNNPCAKTLRDKQRESRDGITKECLRLMSIGASVNETAKKLGISRNKALRHRTLAREFLNAE